MRADRRSGAWLGFALAALVSTVSCAEVDDPVAPGAPDGSIEALAPGGAGRPLSTQVRLKLSVENDAFYLEGEPTGFNVIVENSSSDLANVRVDAMIVQGPASRLAASFPVNCPPNSAGGLPQGTCSMGGQGTATNSAPGTGTLVPGAAQLVVTILRDAGSATTVLASKKMGIVLLPATSPPSIADLVMPSTELIIGGAGTPYTVTLSNPSGAPVSEVLLQGEVVQGGVVRGGGGTNVRCSPVFEEAVLTVGTCIMEWSAVALAAEQIDGKLEPGPAEFVLSLLQGFSTTVVLDSRTIPVTLVSGEPAIVSIDFPAGPLVINGDRVNYSFTVRNPTAADLTDVSFQSRVVQETGEYAAGGLAASCGEGNFVLPPGLCTMSFTAGASTTTGTGTLQPGPATFVLIMNQTTDFVTSELHRLSVEIELVASE